MKTITIIFALTYFCNNVRGIEQKEVSITNPSRFDSLLTQTEKELGVCCDATIQFFSSKTFQKIYDSSYMYITDIKMVLSDSKQSNFRKQICIYVVQKVDLKTYCILTSHCIDLYKKKLLNEELLDKVFFPRGFKSSISMRFISNYKNKDVAILFKSALAMKGLSKNFRQRLKSAQSGKALRERQKMEASGYSE